MKGISELVGDHLLKQDGTKLATTVAFSGKTVVGLYFSARWCPSCKGFTEKLVAFQKKINNPSSTFRRNANENSHYDSLQMVLVSSDRSEEDFANCFQQQDWYSIPYVDRDRKVNDNN